MNSYYFHKVSELKQIMDCITSEDIQAYCNAIASTNKLGKKIFICGNGGSGATANLVASSLSTLPSSTEKYYQAISLSSNMTLINSISSCYGYEEIFSRQVLSLGAPGDLIIAISGSGNSENIIRAVLESKTLGMNTFGLTGMGGGLLASIADKSLIVQSNDMEQIENAHVLINHFARTQLFNSNSNNVEVTI